MASINLAVVGDINIRDRERPADVPRLIAGRLRAADLVVGNLEMCLSGPEHGIPFKTEWRQSQPEMAEALVAAGIHMVTTANNVTFGAESIEATRKVLDAHGIAHTGSGADDAAARVPAIVERGGLRVALVGWTCLVYPFGHAASAGAAGVATIRCHTAYEPHKRASELPGVPPVVRSWPDPDELEKAVEDVRRAREQADLVLAYLHMGVSSQREVSEYQYLASRAMIDAGAAAVFGASAHKAQAMEVHKGKPIFYGLGNLCLDYPKLVDRRDGVLVECVLTEHGVTEASFVPIHRTVEDNVPQVVPADAGEGARIVESVIADSAPLGTTFTVAADRVTVGL